MIQSIRVVDVPEFRTLIRLLRPELQERAIPHRTLICKQILEEYRRTMANIMATLSVRMVLINRF